MCTRDSRARDLCVRSHSSLSRAAPLLILCARQVSDRRFSILSERSLHLYSVVFRCVHFSSRLSSALERTGGGLRSSASSESRALDCGADLFALCTFRFTLEADPSGGALGAFGSSAHCHVSAHQLSPNCCLSLGNPFCVFHLSSRGQQLLHHRLLPVSRAMMAFYILYKQ